MKLIYKDFAINIKAVGESKNTIRAVFSTPIEDRHGEIVDQSGWVLNEFLKNPVVLFGHDHFQPAIGKVNDIGIVDGNLEGTIEFAVEEYDFAKTIYNLYVGGFMRAISVGYMNIEQDVQNDVVVHRKNILYEVSCVNVPANALALAKSKGIDVSSVEKMMQKADVKVGDVCELPDGGGEGIMEMNDDGEMVCKPKPTEDAKVEENETEKQKNERVEKYGRVLSKTNRGHVEKAKAALDEVLKADDDEEQQSADTRGTSNKGQKPLTSQGGHKKRIAIRVINKAVRALLDEKKLLEVKK